MTATATANTTPATPSRTVSPAERRADATVHALGLTAALAGAALLLHTIQAAPHARATLATSLYILGLVATFACSAAYNTAPDGPRKHILRRLDHAAIFLMIAGTYTPVALLGIGGPWGTALCAAVWAGALPGMALKLLAPGRYERAAFAAYLALGWLGVLALPAMLQSMPHWQTATIAAGGLLYTAGTAFHVADRLPYSTAIWHAFVLAAAACHFTVVLALAAG
ncbi:PAQR family membrane homeostasis protein TrhA [Roseomonas populi]|uniref:Hemolysin III family protein n=1 Tax=Roseomonas populi TaxID=3121582 RepID=A0ABT1X866_9PROT|nr:hemolysin III family protein [Roseomonas pecuniae]MCR0984307.1 hemolysin III family protein [Roseomonas pecuniae]